VTRSPVARALVGAIRFYRTAISPIRPPACRYVPTCSAYALEAVEVHGAARGLYLALRRLLRCHPFHRGGHDPVPPRVERGDDAAPGDVRSDGEDLAPVTSRSVRPAA
jgi:putative membrane protein insertion efficiency factor